MNLAEDQHSHGTHLHFSPTTERSPVTEASYRRPPDDILQILDAEPLPSVSISPDRRFLLLADRKIYPPVAELAAPLLKLAGLRINPETSGPHLAPRYCGLRLLETASQSVTPISLPDDARITLCGWSPNARFYAFTLTHSDHIELWVLETENCRARRVSSVPISATYAVPVHWLPDSEHLLVLTVPSDRGPMPEKPRTPRGPVIEEATGVSGPVRTYPDMLQSPYDAELFEYFCRSQLMIISVLSGSTKMIGEPQIFGSVDESPDGQLLLVVRHERPWSYTLPVTRFPRRTEVWDRNGDVIYTLHVAPLQDAIPIEGVPLGPRFANWRPTEPATLTWLEALDGGDPKRPAEFRDAFFSQAAPFDQKPRELIRIQQRCTGLTWGAESGTALIRDYDRDRRWTRTLLFHADDTTVAPQVLWERSVNDRYGDPGSPMTRPLPNGRRVLWQHEDWIFLESTGATPRGDRPFLARFNLQTRQSERLFTCDDESYESVVALLSDDGTRFLTQHETPLIPPNYFIRSCHGERRALTQFPDPMPQLRNIRKEIVTCQRDDGVTISFTLYLPNDFVPGQPRPTVLWAYPREFNDSQTAGQISGSTNHFTVFGGISHLFLLTRGYVVLDDVTMPVVGDPETANDTFIPQIVSSAKAAIDKAVEMGVTDRTRVGIGGHSYGAFMTAHLLAHTDFFKAGVARSGAYNRTLTPFGFQNERRTFWEAMEIYMQLSPFTHAHRIRTPLLLMHGDSDNNPGTFPLQSERLYQAIRGNGGSVRYVVLPHESHGYIARESIEHTLWEMIEWFGRFL